MLASLMHDLGKQNATELTDGRITSYRHPETGMRLAEAQLTRLTTNARTIAYVKNMTLLHMRPNMMAQARSKRLKTRRMFDESACPEDLILLSRADASGKTDRPYQMEHWTFLQERAEGLLRVRVAAHGHGCGPHKGGLQAGQAHGRDPEKGAGFALLGARKEARAQNGHEGISAGGLKMAHTRDMTKGSPSGHIVLFALPLMLGNVFQQLYTATDAAVVGQFAGVEGVGRGGLRRLAHVAVVLGDHRVHAGLFHPRRPALRRAGRSRGCAARQPCPSSLARASRFFSPSRASLRSGRSSGFLTPMNCCSRWRPIT